MQNCKVVYPLRIVRPLKKFPVDHREQLSFFIEDILSALGKIEQFIADNLKRANAKECLNHASTFPCEYCFQKGSRLPVKCNVSKTQQQLKVIRDKIEEKKNSDATSIRTYESIEKELEKAEKLVGRRGSRIVWPASSANGEPRSTQKIIEIVENIEENGKLPADQAKGVVGRSVFLSIPRFDFVIDIPAEYLHSVCIGVTKRLIELTFSVGEARPRITTRKLSSPIQYNVLMQKIKVFKECSRRNRDLDFSVMKGQELRNIVLFFFPVVLMCIEKPAQERKLWVQYVYMIRACVIPSKEFAFLDLDIIEKTCSDFYKLYEKLFGCSNCTYNTHVVGSHLIEMRSHGPLTQTSAFGFEAFYGEIRNSFTPGTQSSLKQIFQKILIRRILGHHCCENKIYFSNTETSLENDTIFYCFQDGTHKMYKIIEVYEDSILCYKQGRYDCTFPEMPHLKFSQIGVYKRGPRSDETCIIPIKKISGKVICVEDYLITGPNNVLREK